MGILNFFPQIGKILRVVIKWLLEELVIGDVDRINFLEELLQL
jgi:hypothetical protein